MPTARKSAPKAAEAAPTEKENTVTDTDATMQKARSTALARIRDAHREEYNAFLVEEAAKLGITWAPRPSAKERAEEKLRALIAEYPELKDQLA